jgi:hypothetical protein
MKIQTCPVTQNTNFLNKIAVFSVMTLHRFTGSYQVLREPAMYNSRVERDKDGKFL